MGMLREDAHLWSDIEPILAGSRDDAGEGG